MKLDGFPDYVKDYHEEVASQYDSPQIGNRVAWEAVKYRLSSVGDNLVAQRQDFNANRLFRIDMEATDQQLVHQADDGSYVLDAVLTSTKKGVQGRYFTRKDLETLAERINSNGITAPEIEDHEEFMNVAVAQAFDPDAIRDTLADMRGMVNDAEATVKDGKLWLQAKLDESFENIANGYSGVSVEALANVQEDGRMKDPEPVGFIFTDDPKNPEAQVVS